MNSCAAILVPSTVQAQLKSCVSELALKKGRGKTISYPIYVSLTIRNSVCVKWDADDIILVDCTRVARAHNFIELLEVIIMVREVVFIHRSRAFIEKRAGSCFNCIIWFDFCIK